MAAREGESKETTERRRRVNELKSAFETPSTTPTAIFGLTQRRGSVSRRISHVPVDYPSSPDVKPLELKASPLPDLPKDSEETNDSTPSPSTVLVQPANTDQSLQTTSTTSISSSPSSFAASSSISESTAPSTVASKRVSALSISSMKDVTLDDSDQVDSTPSSASEEEFSTIDVDRFSTVALHTPTSETAMSSADEDEDDEDPNPPTNQSRVSRIFSSLSILTSPKLVSDLHDDGVDIGTTHAGTYGEQDLTIDTKKANGTVPEQDALRTPVPGSSVQPGSFLGTPSPGPLSNQPMSPVSPSNVEFLLKRLDKDKMDPQANRNRASLEAKGKFKEDIQKLVVSHDSGDPDQADWGVSLSFSDTRPRTDLAQTFGVT